MNSGFIDLHIHSRFSNDGTLSPEEIASKAKELNFCAIAIADHDTIDGVNEGILAAQKYEIEYIPAVEVTTELNTHYFHVLAYFIDNDHVGTIHLINRLKEIRMNKNLFRVDRINKMGIKVSDDIIAMMKRGVLVVGPTLAGDVFRQDENRNHPVIIQCKEKASKDAIILFYKDIIKKIDKEYEEKRWLSTLEAIEMINNASAVPVLAHPGADLFHASTKEIALLKEHGLEGLEVYSSYHTPEKVEYYKQIAKDLGLLITGGSDYHGAIKPRVPFGCIKIDDYTIVENLRAVHLSKSSLH